MLTVRFDVMVDGVSHSIELGTPAVVQMIEAVREAEYWLPPTPEQAAEAAREERR